MQFQKLFPLSIRLSDTGADKDVRMSESRDADIVLLCLPLEELKGDLQVLTNELRPFMEGAHLDRIVLVGTKSDLNDDDTIKNKGWSVARELCARIYLECSSTNLDSVRELFKKVIDIHTNTAKKNAVSKVQFYTQPSVDSIQDEGETKRRFSW